MFSHLPIILHPVALDNEGISINGVLPIADNRPGRSDYFLGLIIPSSSFAVYAAAAFFISPAFSLA
jgi:hypothetical protein